MKAASHEVNFEIYMAIYEIIIWQNIIIVIYNFIAILNINFNLKFQKKLRKYEEKLDFRWRQIVFYRPATPWRGYLE